MKLTIGRIFEASKVIATKSGQELQEFFTYFSSFSEQTIRALRNGLTFNDNFQVLSKVVELSNNTDQIMNTGGKTPIGMIPFRVLSTAHQISSFGWYINDSNQVIVNMGFTNAPSEPLQVLILVFY